MSTNNLDSQSANTKVLIIYYTYSGNTGKVAQEIHKIVGGDMVKINPLEPYPSNYNAVVEQAKQELHTGYKPKIRVSVNNIASYDTVFVGSPNWWHTIAPPVITLLSESDMSGKTIIPFITHGGGGLGRSAEDIAALCPHANVLKSLSVYGADVKSVQKWLAANWPI